MRIEFQIQRIIIKFRGKVPTGSEKTLNAYRRYRCSFKCSQRWLRALLFMRQSESCGEQGIKRIVIPSLFLLMTNFA